MKRYLVFFIEQYYPGGGWTDFQGDFETLEEARAYTSQYKNHYDWCQIVDLNTGEDLGGEDLAADD